jgi:hypothetical protein
MLLISASSLKSSGKISFSEDISPGQIPDAFDFIFDNLNEVIKDSEEMKCFH